MSLKVRFLVLYCLSCTPPLSVLLFVTLLEQPPYSDDTQLFFSFCLCDVDSSITQLQHSLRKISFWMTANLLTLNSFKTEFLLVGLPQQLAKINTSSLITTDSARNLVLPRCMEYRRGLAMRILSVRLSVCHTPVL